MKDVEYEDARKHLSQLYIVAEGLVLFGGLLIWNTHLTSKFSTYFGVFIFLLGGVILLAAIGLRFSKRYRNLRENSARINKINEEVESLVKDYGIVLPILALLFILAIFVGAIYFAYYWTHSWLEVIMFVLAFTLISNIKEYFEPDEDDE